MTTEWLKVMLDEIERKRLDAEQAQIEEQRRAREAAPAGIPLPSDPPRG